MADDEQNEAYFDVIQKIGEGGNADVFLLKQRVSGALFAGKFLREAWDPYAREQFRLEASRQSRVAGSHVVPVIGGDFDATRPFFILEYMPRGSLADELARHGKFGERKALLTIREIAVAVAKLHADRVVHRDLKPGNILRADDKRLVLNDLGIAATLTSGQYAKAAGFVGTPAYVTLITQGAGRGWVTDQVLSGTEAQRPQKT